MSFYAEFAAHYEAIFPFSETVYTFLRRYLPPSGVVLDVGCGTGHYAGRLAADGFAAVGVDLDAAMIAYAQRHYPQAAFHCLNMLNLADLGQTFDAIFCIGNTAAHLTPAQLARFLDAGRRSLAPGGIWIVQVMNWDYVLTQSAVTFPVITAGNTMFYREYRAISTQQVTFHTRLTVGDAEVFADATPLYPLRSVDILAAHTHAGFTRLGHFADYAGHPFDPTTFSANLFVFRQEI
jgi:SAM-dependent methyltransferase